MTNQQHVMITGNSSGLGKALTEACLQRGDSVYGLSRRGCAIQSARLHDKRCDLADTAAIEIALADLLAAVPCLHLVILNAGILGEIRDLSVTPLSIIERLMQVNVWANKIILDYLINRQLAVQQVVLISSGAAVSGHRGWSAYSLSKATLNMLGRLYAGEMVDTHFTSLAPGLIDTAMQDYLCDPQNADVKQFPSLQSIRNARGTEAMPTPSQAAEKMLTVFPRLRREFPSGEFVDVRNLT
jgi:NAD(P)-dependent dehydrogenase (short-subunit alcohol dehydrogenase family)